jgi:hypothetical protein
MVSRSYRIGVESGLSWAYAAMTVLFASSWLVVGVADGDEVGPGLRVAIAAYVALAAIEVWRGARLRLSALDVAATTVVSVLVQAAWALDEHSPFGPGQRTMVTVAVVFGAIMFTASARRMIAPMIAVGAQVAADSVRMDPVTAIADLWPVAAAGIAIWACVPAMREAARRADVAADDQERSAREAAAQAGTRRARLEVQGILHDDVVAALRAVSLTEVSESEACHAASGAVSAIQRSPVAADDLVARDLAQLVGDLAPVPGTVTTFRPGEAMIVPGFVALAVAAATGEVLRNIARHARAGHVQVTLDRDGDGFTLLVVDDGIGFQVATAMSRSHGLRYSVIHRLQDVGGRAEVTSAPGRGTTVRLAWQPVAEAPAPEPNRAERMAAALEDVRRPLAAVCLSYLVMTGVFAIRYTVDGSVPAWTLAWFAGLCAITLALLARADTGLSGRSVTAALGYGVGGAVASLFVLPVTSLHDYSSWPLGATTALLAVVVIVRPSWEAAAGLAIQQGAIVVAALAGRFGADPWTTQIAAVTPAALSTVEPVILGLVVGQAVLRLGDVVTRSNATLRAATAAESALRAREAIHQHRLSDLNEEILPFLLDIATGSTTSTCPGIRDRARTLEHGARDELHLPGVLDAPTRELLRRARDGGCVVTIQSTSSDIESGELVRGLLAAALTAGSPPHELVLSIEDSSPARGSTSSPFPATASAPRA